MSYIGLPVIPVVAQRIKKGIITAPSNIIIVQGGYVYNQIAIYINGARIFTGYTANDGVNIVFDETLPSGTEWVVEELFNAGKSIIQATEQETLDGVEGVFPDAKDVKGILDSRIKQTTGTSTTDVMSQKAVTDALQWQSTPVGSVLAMRYGTSEPPKDSSLYRYVKLTANQTGAGQYNEGILTNQTTTGSGATLRITAKINFPSSPLHDTTIDLTNSCSIAVEAGTTRGAYDGDKMQNVTGSITGIRQILAGEGTGPFSISGRADIGNFGATGTGNRADVDFNLSAAARTGTRTKPKTVTEEEYLRIL